ncbi:hypothetical protein ZEAMMB73_Zm00001d022113 [Zea mays]|uniref:Uncharacterized protein n=1 Tax=Zea mays TaxID=4577 RepID=A0A1D6IJA8_MAIZE|nr:hypothetical protein ZEAMMB73_Zm00001d022113 [Zea mays]
MYSFVEYICYWCLRHLLFCFRTGNLGDLGFQEESGDHPDDDARWKAHGFDLSGSEVLQHGDICQQIIILYDRGRIQRYFFTIWHRRGSSTYERPPNWKDEGIWFCQIFIASRGRESCQGNGWQGHFQINKNEGETGMELYLG